MKALHSLTFVAAAAIGLTTITAASGVTEPPHGTSRPTVSASVAAPRSTKGDMLFCYNSGTYVYKDDVASAITRFCQLWDGYGLKSEESIWNTMPMTTGITKLDMLSIADATMVLDPNECEEQFEIILDNCNVNSNGSEGGNYFDGSVYWMMQIDPPIDEQTNGTHNQKRPDSGLSSPSSNGVQSVDNTETQYALVEAAKYQLLESNQAVMSCDTDGGIASWPDGESHINEFCAAPFGGSLDTSYSFLQTSTLGRRVVQVCPTGHTLDVDWDACETTLMSLMTYCGQGNGLSTGGVYLETCVTWSIYIEKGSQDVSKRDTILMPARSWVMDRTPVIPLGPRHLIRRYAGLSMNRRKEYTTYSSATMGVQVCTDYKLGDGFALADCLYAFDMWAWQRSDIWGRVCRRQ